MPSRLHTAEKFNRSLSLLAKSFISALFFVYCVLYLLSSTLFLLFFSFFLSFFLFKYCLFRRMELILFAITLDEQTLLNYLSNINVTIIRRTNIFLTEPFFTIAISF